MSEELNIDSNLINDAIAKSLRELSIVFATTMNEHQLSHDAGACLLVVMGNTLISNMFANFTRSVVKNENRMEVYLLLIEHLYKELKNEAEKTIGMFNLHNGDNKDFKLGETTIKKLFEGENDTDNS